MPTTKDDLPDTVRCSSAKAQRTFAAALDAAIDQYGDGERAYRTAWSALKHTHEKVGNRWVAKDEPGPSEEDAPEGAPNPNTAGGVDVAGHTKDELYQRAKQLGVEGRSRMNKLELAQAIARKQD